MRLSPLFRYAIYAALAGLFVTGAAWLVVDRLKDTPAGDMWQSISADLLMLHGGLTMVTLMLFGALFPLHIRLSWQRRKNRTTGVLMLSFNALLIMTAFGLYYLGPEMLRPWMSWVHTIIGLSLPALAFTHILIGRQNR